MTAWTAGPRNLITDVAGLKVGHADDATVGWVKARNPELLRPMRVPVARGGDGPRRTMIVLLHKWEGGLNELGQ